MTATTVIVSLGLFTLLILLIGFSKAGDGKPPSRLRGASKSEAPQHSQLSSANDTDKPVTPASEANTSAESGATRALPANDLVATLMHELVTSGRMVVHIADFKGIVDFSAALADSWRQQTKFGHAVTAVKAVPCEEDFLAYLDMSDKDVVELVRTEGQFAIKPGTSLMSFRKDSAEGIFDHLQHHFRADGELRTTFGKFMKSLDELRDPIVQLVSHAMISAEMGLVEDSAIPQSYLLTGGVDLVVVTAYAGSLSDLSIASIGGRYSDYLWFLRHSNPYVVKSKRSGSPYRGLINIIIAIQGSTVDPGFVIQPLPPCGTDFTGFATEGLLDTAQRLNGGQRRQKMASQVFVSYSHLDSKWLRRLQIHLKPLVREGLVELWDDTRIKPGDEWRKQIEAALDRAGIAVFLISADFLPPLLARAAGRGVRVMPIIVGHCLFAENGALSKYQAVNAPDRPLIAMSEHEAEEVLLKAARAISEHIRSQ